MRIVVADDNALVRELFVAFLEESGAICHHAPDGETALTLATREQPDAIVLDLAMPRGDGTTIARQLRAHLGDALRIVTVSAHAGDREREGALAAGANVFLAKPVELVQLAAAIVGRVSDAQQSPSSKRIDLLARLNAQFRADAAAQRHAVVSALTDGDHAAVRARAHYLKNSATVVNDEALFDACTLLESAAERHDAAGLALAWSRCEHALGHWTRPTSNSLPVTTSANDRQSSNLNSHG